MVQHHTGMGTLQQGEHLNSMRHIREDIMATAYASYIMELVERVVEEGSQSHLRLMFYYMHYKQLRMAMILKPLHCLLNGRCYHIQVYNLFYMPVLRVAL